MINNRDEIARPLAKTLANVYKNISRCKICGTLKPNSIDCSYSNCEIIKKKYDKICVVENLADQWSIENSNIFNGYFHILGGTISANKNNDQILLVNSLVRRVKEEKIEEVIMQQVQLSKDKLRRFILKIALKI